MPDGCTGLYGWRGKKGQKLQIPSTNIQRNPESNVFVQCRAESGWLLHEDLSFEHSKTQTEAPRTERMMKKGKKNVKQGLTGWRGSHRHTAKIRSGEKNG